VQLGPGPPYLRRASRDAAGLGPKAGFLRPAGSFRGSRGGGTRSAARAAAVDQPVSARFAGPRWAGATRCVVPRRSGLCAPPPWPPWQARRQGSGVLLGDGHSPERLSVGRFVPCLSERPERPTRRSAREGRRQRLTKGRLCASESHDARFSIRRRRRQTRRRGACLLHGPHPAPSLLGPQTTGQLA